MENRASMVVTYFIKPFRTGAGRPNDILISHLLLVAETKLNKGRTATLPHGY